MLISRLSMKANAISVIRSKRTAWLGAYFLPKLALLDLGDARLVASSEDHLFYGVNLAIRRDVLEAAGGFNEALGHRGSRLGGGEDTEVLALTSNVSATLNGAFHVLPYVFTPSFPDWIPVAMATSSPSNVPSAA